jgi:hypothetical protein
MLLGGNEEEISTAFISMSSSRSIGPTSLSKGHLERFKENRNNGDFPLRALPD